MGLFDWVNGGANFKPTLKGKVGDIIYPAYNGTNGWFTTSRWDVVTKIDKDGNIIGRRYIWDFATVEAIKLIQECSFLTGGRND